jgi:hypothetical protein
VWDLSTGSRASEVPPPLSLPSIAFLRSESQSESSECFLSGVLHCVAQCGWGRGLELKLN